MGGPRCQSSHKACTSLLVTLPSNRHQVTEKLHPSNGSQKMGRPHTLATRALQLRKALLWTSQKTLSFFPPTPQNRPPQWVWSSSNSSERTALSDSDTCQMRKRKGADTWWIRSWLICCSLLLRSIRVSKTICWLGCIQMTACNQHLRGVWKTNRGSKHGGIYVIPLFRTRDILEPLCTQKVFSISF